MSSFCTGSGHVALRYPGTNVTRILLNGPLERKDPDVWRVLCGSFKVDERDIFGWNVTGMQLDGGPPSTHSLCTKKNESDQLLPHGHGIRCLLAD